MPKSKSISPALRDEICTRFAATHNASEVSRATGVSDHRVRQIWHTLTAEEREQYSASVRTAVQAAADRVLSTLPDETASYATTLLRVRSKALATIERMLDALPADNPKYFPLLKEIGRLLHDLHDIADSTESPQSSRVDDFYQLLKSPSTINIQNNYYGKRETESPDTGDRPRLVR